MLLRHWSRGPLGEVYPVKGFYRDGHPLRHGKPTGFWLSDESQPDSWSTYVGKRLAEPLGYWADFEIGLDQILHLKDETDLFAFTENYMIDCFLGMGGVAIEWPLVAADYQGVLITPYIKEACLALDWYYGWDCASAVVWDTSCLTEMERGYG